MTQIGLGIASVLNRLGRAIRARTSSVRRRRKTAKPSVVLTEQARERLRYTAAGQILAGAKTSPASPSNNPGTADTHYTEVEVGAKEHEREIFEAQRRLSEAIKRLPPKYRNVIRPLRGGKSLTAIARMLKTPVSTLHSRKEAGIRELRKTIHPSDVAVLLNEMNTPESATEWTTTPGSGARFEDLGDDRYADRVDRIPYSYATSMYGDGVFGMSVKDNPNKTPKAESIKESREHRAAREWLKANVATGR